VKHFIPFTPSSYDRTIHQDKGGTYMDENVKERFKEGGIEREIEHRLEEIEKYIGFAKECESKGELREALCYLILKSVVTIRSISRFC